jgi:hypothetical protein
MTELHNCPDHIDLRAAFTKSAEEPLNICGFGITQDGFTARWKATGVIEGVGWLEARGGLPW